MTDTRPPPLVIENIPSIAGGVSAMASANAPFIYFDSIQTCGFFNDVAYVALEAVRFMDTGEQSIPDRVIIAHLRMSPRTLALLKGAIEKIESDIRKQSAAVKAAMN